ncbi:MAG TPA: hypothetical protein VEI95_00055 [Acidobacteriota bacterium]|nr:hypothetical protein [Acidobacteriota bacterium]
MKVTAMTLIVGLLVGSAALGRADTTTDLNNQATTMNSLATSPGQNNVTNKIGSDFKSFLGSDANTVVTGLRNGTPINLTRTTTTPSTTVGGMPVTTTTTTTITPSTGQMGYGNVYISLALAKQQLSTLGINQPTPEQLQAALTGGTITQTTAANTTTTNLPGILTLRSQNMGWGQIAQKLGYKLGPIISSIKSANQSLAASTHTPASASGLTTATGPASSTSNGGIVSGSGKVHGNSNQVVSGSNGSSEGIVTAAGRGNGKSYGVNHSGIVTASGGSTASSHGGIVSARGSGNGVTNGNGHGK